MDATEDLSARVLLRHILTTEPPKTPITRSASKTEFTQSTSNTRCSSRQGHKDAGAQTPRDALRRSLKHKIQESITRKSLPATKRRTASAVLRMKNTPTPTSVLLDDGETPRHILMNILRTEPARSPVVHERAASEEPQSANYSITSKRPSTELSGLDLPDITIGIAASTAKGLSRKRPRRSLNVTAFEKRLGDGDDVEEENEESIGNHSSLSLSSSNSLSLKTPYVDIRTEKRGLQRRVSNRRKITEEEFGAAVNKRQMGGASSFVLVDRGLSETACSEGFTLGLSKLSEPDITTDIVHCNTALYAQPDAGTSNFSIVATQDKPTVMASQLQRQMELDEQMEAEQEKEKSMWAFPTERVVAEPQNEECLSQLEEDADEAILQKQKGESAAESEPGDDAAMSKLEEEDGTADSQASVRGDTARSEEEENRVGTQTEEEGASESQTEEDAAIGSQSQEGDVVPSSQTEEDGTVDFQPEEDAAATSQSEEEEVALDSQTEEEEEGAVNSQSEEEEEVAEHQSDQEEPAEFGFADSPPENEPDGEEDGASEQLERDLEHISRRAHRSEAGLLIPVTEAGWSDGKSNAHRTFDLCSSLEMRSHEGSQLHAGDPGLAESSTQGRADASCAESDANKENSFHLPEVTQDIEDSGHRSDDSPEEAAAQEPAEQDEEWEDEEEEGEDEEDKSEVVPSKTPAFVRQKMTLFRPDPPASPSVLKNIHTSSPSRGEGLPAPKPKQVRKTRTGPVKKEAGLPKSYLMGVFKHFAKTKVSADVYPALKEIMDKFFERMAEDLETYAVHARRKTIEVEDVELLLKRQGHVNDKVPVEVLIEKYLRMDQRKLLIPIATSGNVVIPKKRR